MSVEKEIPQVSMANTKKEMIDAYQIVKKQLMAKEKERLDAQKSRKEMEKQLAATTAESETAKDPLKRLYDLRSAISRELAGLGERFEQELDTYRQIQAAVKAKQEELDTMYGVETAASDLAALLEAQHVKKEEFKRDMEQKRMALDEEIRETRARWHKERLEQDQKTKEEAEAVKRQQQRDKEEYEYAFDREKDQKRNGLEDELRALENDIAQKRKHFEQELHERKAELDVREEVVTKRERDISTLQAEVDSFPKRLEDRVKSEVKQTTERLSHDFEKSKALLKAQFQGEKNVLSSKIEALEKFVAAHEAQMTELSRRNEQAYEKVQDIANRAVAAAKREYIAIPTTAQATGNQTEKHNT